ncbi:MAG: VWA domain-containing protein [Bacteroidales bacterium]
MIWNDITFGSPVFLYGLFLIPVLIFVYLRNYHKRHAAVRYSSLKGLEGSRSWRVRLYPLLFVFRMLALCLLIISLARPQISSKQQDISIEGIDIILSLDISSSMLAADFKPNRLEAAKAVAKDFVQERRNDRLGLVIFAGEAFSQCPLTTDHHMVNTVIDDISINLIEDGTAIGNGIATAIQRLKDSKAKSKVTILLTDGVNNRGAIDPLTSAEMAKLFGIRIYTIGVGSQGVAKTPVAVDPVSGDYIYRQREVNIDEELLKEISDKTNAKYFRATDKESLSEIYHNINQLEKSKIEVQRYENKQEIFFLFTLIAVSLLIIELLLRKSLFQTIP